MKTFKHLLVVLLIATLAGGWLWWSARPKPVRVVVAPVERGTVEKTVSNTRAGTVKACRPRRAVPPAPAVRSPTCR